MKKRTTTQKLGTAIADNLLHIEKVEKYNKTTCKTTTISTDTFKEGLDFLCETIFSDAIGWYYELNYETANYEVECSRMNGSVDFIFIAHLCVNDGVDREDVDNVLNVIEEE